MMYPSLNSIRNFAFFEDILCAAFALTHALKIRCTTYTQIHHNIYTIQHNTTQHTNTKMRTLAPNVPAAALSEVACVEILSPKLKTRIHKYASARHRHVLEYTPGVR